MQVWVKLEVLSPTVEDREEADLRAQMLSVSRDRLQCFRRGLEENVVNHLLVLVGNRSDLFWYGEDHVKIGNIEEFRLPLLDPLPPGQALAFGAVSIPAIGQACCVGDQRPFVSALVVLDPEVAPGWFAERGIQVASLAELAAHPEAYDVLQRAVDEAMVRFSNVERVKRVAVLGDEWLPDGDELTPTSKLKRRSILAKYADQIEGIYG